MTPFDEDVLERAMHRLKAQERLEDPDYIDRLTMDGFYDLLVSAGFTEEEATRETSKRSWNRLISGEAI